MLAAQTLCIFAFAYCRMGRKNVSLQLLAICIALYVVHASLISCPQCLSSSWMPLP